MWGELQCMTRAILIRGNKPSCALYVWCVIEVQGSERVMRILCILLGDVREFSLL